MELNIEKPTDNKDEEVNEESLEQVFVNFFHKGLGKYVSRLFSSDSHGENFLDVAKEFASNPEHTVETTTSGKIDEPTLTDEAVHEVV